MLSILIVNYKSPQLVSDCLQTVFAHNAFNAEVLVIDNDSGDNSREIITKAFPEVRWVQMDYNAGFARANNEGIRQSKGDVVLLLNPDTLIRDNVLQSCYEALLQSGCAGCGVQLLNPDQTPQISGNYAVTGGLNYLLPLPYIGALIKWLGNLSGAKKPNIPEAVGRVEVDWINGAFLMVKKEAIGKAGLLDEDFFLYAEEAEWCSRLKKAGPLCIFGQYNVIHLQGETANQAFGSSGKGYYNLYDRKGLQIMLSNFLRIRKQFGTSWYLFQLLVYTATIPVFFLFSFFENSVQLKNPFTDFKRAGRFARNVTILWRYMPVIISGRPYFYKVL